MLRLLPDNSFPGSGPLVRSSPQRPPLTVFSLAALLFLGATFLSGCQAAPVNPVDVSEADACAQCKSPIYEKQYAAEIITSDRFARKFDDIQCMLQYAGTRLQGKTVAAYYVMDYASQSWLNAEEAAFVRSERIATPQNGGILAFRDKTGAEALAREQGAELLTFADLRK